MRLSHFAAFAPVCPVCRVGEHAHPLTLAAVMAGAAGEVTGGILHCSNPACQHEFPVVDGIPLIVPDLSRLLAERGVEFFTRDDLDPTLQGLLGDGLGPDSWFGVLRQTLSTYGWDAYADLDPEEVPPVPGAPAPGAARRCLERLLALVGAAATDSEDGALALDLGCATGRTSFDLATASPGALVLGIDSSPALLRVAQQALRGEVSYPRRRIGMVHDVRRFQVDLAGAERVDFWACDAQALPFRGETVALVSALNILDCVPEPRRLLAQIEAVLKPGGRALFATPYDWSTRATPVETWIGGHSQRAAHKGAAEPFLRQLLTPGSHPQSLNDLHIATEELNWPWTTRLHERSAVSYLAHLFTVEKSAA